MIKPEHLAAAQSYSGDFLFDYEDTPDVQGNLFFDTWNGTCTFLPDSDLVDSARESADDPELIKSNSDALEFFTGHLEMEIAATGAVAEILAEIHSSN